MTDSSFLIGRYIIPGACIFRELKGNRAETLFFTPGFTRHAGYIYRLWQDQKFRQNRIKILLTR
jgi:hypothetical protein